MAVVLLAMALTGIPAEAAPQTALEANELQRRIDAAQEGDIITVPAGEYEGAIVIDKPVTLRGEPGARLANPAAVRPFASAPAERR
ncbi:hypothetical protein [Paenibacillus spongiae]|uniref:Pectate lyase superfamily protein domain-containing protein n=1 Tax=Paenibacillus spongiae TaxID=2909671 RepID=A0ABY5SAK3_9BACL|nr:hypothetical protein [Paenibacillus spongiae]UVI30769.1 hypothetical protein L1F29_02495 [Paenibacillus spongiae]